MFLALNRSQPRSVLKNWQKEHKNWKFSKVLTISVSICGFFHRLFFQKHLLDNIVFCFERFQHSKQRRISRMWQNKRRTLKNWKIEQFWHFWKSIWGHSGVFGVKQKISTNTYWMKPNGWIMGGRKRKRKLWFFYSGFRKAVHGKLQIFRL